MLRPPGASSVCGADLDAAFNQLRQYALALENPPLLIVSDKAWFRIRTNWTNCVSEVHEFALEDLADGAVRDKPKWTMSDPERLRPGVTRQTVTARASTTFADPPPDTCRRPGHRQAPPFGGACPEWGEPAQRRGARTTPVHAC